MTILAVVIIAVGALVLASSVRVLPETERLAVVRAGQVVGLKGPGIVTLVPMVERGVRVVLDRDVPEWRSLSRERLLERVRLHVTS